MAKRVTWGGAADTGKAAANVGPGTRSAMAARNNVRSMLRGLMSGSSRIVTLVKRGRLSSPRGGTKCRSRFVQAPRSRAGTTHPLNARLGPGGSSSVPEYFHHAPPAITTAATVARADEIRTIKRDMATSSELDAVRGRSALGRGIGYSRRGLKWRGVVRSADGQLVLRSGCPPRN